MTIKHLKLHGLAWILAATAAAGPGLAGCESQPAATRSSLAGMNMAGASKGELDGARIWEENCSRCHNLRSPREFSYDQWQVIVHHMRLRATLTADETRAVLKFLKAAQ